MKELDEIQREIEESKSQLMSREKAFGKEDHRELLYIENKFKKKRQSYICLYCGEKSKRNNFELDHKCKHPQVVLEKIRSLPSRPIKNIFFKVIYNEKVYEFKDYLSAMKFRSLVWTKKMSIKEAKKDKSISWWKQKN